MQQQQQVSEFEEKVVAVRRVAKVVRADAVFLRSSRRGWQQHRNRRLWNGQSR